MRTLPILVLLLAAPAAQAERLAFECRFTARCDEAGCTAANESYAFRFDTDAGSGEMLSGGQSYPGSHLSSDSMHHFLFVNGAGAELTSIASDGSASYSGHMSFMGATSWYRLDGQCAARTK